MYHVPRSAMFEHCVLPLFLGEYLVCGSQLSVVVPVRVFVETATACGQHEEWSRDREGTDTSHRPSGDQIV